MTVSRVRKQSHGHIRASCGTQDATHAEHKGINQAVAKRWIIGAAGRLSGVGFIQQKHIDATHEMVSQVLTQVVLGLFWYQRRLRVGQQLQLSRCLLHKPWLVGTVNGLGTCRRLAHERFALFLAIDKALGKLGLL